MKSQLFRFAEAAEHDPQVDAWFEARPAELAALAHHWFAFMRRCGPDIRVLLHDGHPTACVGDVAFAYVNAFSAHVNVGFFRGAELADPQGLLEGEGRFMRHVKLKPGVSVNAAALEALIRIACSDMQERAEAERHASA